MTFLRLSRFCCLSVGVTCVCSLGFSRAVRGQSTQFAFTRVADEESTFPLGGTLFGLFEPAIDEGRVVFSAASEHGPAIYSASGVGEAALPLVTIDTLDPETSEPFGPFASFNLRPSIDNRRVAFGTLAIPDQGDVTEAIHVIESGQVHTIADLNTRNPSGAGNLVMLWSPNESPSADGGQVAFWGTSETGPGVYLAGEDSMEHVAHTGTPVPNDDVTFQDFSSVVLAFMECTVTSEDHFKRSSHKGTFWTVKPYSRQILVPRRLMAVR